MCDYILEMNHITKTFPGVVADNDVTLKVKRESIHALIGENGAGKSTLMNILNGLHRPDSGEILLDGKRVAISTPYESIKLGIGMVHQHFMLVPDTTVLENIILGPRIKTRYGLIDYKKNKEKIDRIIEEFSFPMNLNKKVRELSVGEMQRVEIIKALYRGAEILILDEPTAVLTPQETEKLFDILRGFVSMGKTVLFISHKLKEVLAISDEITVLREGSVAGNIAASEASEQILASMMVGRDVTIGVARDKAAYGDVVLSVDKLRAYYDRKTQTLSDISFELHKGEILGIAGVDGNGQNELIEVLTGLRKKLSGHIMLKGGDISNDTCLSRRKKGIAHIPSDRLRLGINKKQSIFDNMILNVYKSGPYSRYKFMNHKKLKAFSAELIGKYDVAAAGPEVSVGVLSGGNMQKVVVAREIAADPDVLIASQPTRGIDVGAIEFIHKQLIALRDAGKAVLLVSAELDEIMALSDRVLVMYEGAIVAEFENKNQGELEIGLYMTGAKRMERAL